MNSPSSSKKKNKYISSCFTFSQHMTRGVLLSLVIPCVLMGSVKRFKKEVVIIIISSEFFFIKINLQDLIIICVPRCFLFST